MKGGPGRPLVSAQAQQGRAEGRVGGRQAPTVRSRLEPVGQG